MATQLPPQHRALVLESLQAGFSVQSVRTPTPCPGSAIVRIAASKVLSYASEVYSGARPYPFPKPLIAGSNAVGHIAALGADAVCFKEGQLVFINGVVRARDDPDTLFLAGLHEGWTESSRKLMSDVWRDGTFAEFAKVPLENCIPLNEQMLCRELGYTLPELTYLSSMLVPYGGLRDIDVQAGETVIICPATGAFGSAGVLVAAAMGARVIAMGRNEMELTRIREYLSRSGAKGRDVITVKITGDEQTDTAALQPHGPVDAVLDLSPPGAATSTHLRSAMRVLRRGGRVSLMGLAGQYLGAWDIVANDITMKGKFMYSREDILLLIKMLEMGLFPKAGELADVKTFRLEQWKEAFEVAATHTGIGNSVALSS